MMALRVPWDKYEAALLLNYCIRIEKGEISKAEAISTVSQMLRNRAIRKGYEIDDVFRNENGISMQISSMRNCYLGKEQGLTISKLFYETVRLRNNDPEAFNQILQEESENMGTSLWQKFLSWLKQEYPKRERDTLSALMMVNALGRKSRMLKSPLGDITDPEEIRALIKDVGNASLGFQSRRNINAACQALEIYMDYLKTIENDSVEEAEEDEDESSTEISFAQEIQDVDFHSLVAEDERLNAQKRVFICANAISDISVTSVKYQMDTNVVQGVKGLIRAFEDGTTGNCNVQTMQEFQLSLLPTSSINTAFAAFQRLFRYSIFMERWGTEVQWDRLFQEVSKRKNSLEALFDRYGYSDDFEDDLYNNCRRLRTRLTKKR